ncbi:TonB-dependent receptor [Bacteroides sp. OttesenSCG-928-J23]|nr:TonB-dependent receptor [Bacteroides sp. OttesenSCG-928-J23]MDL2303910.1 TonB-dependent receptor [Bacteroides sp. OttesenSCG-928-D19]
MMKHIQTCKICTLIALFIAFSSLSLRAQTRTVTGTILDDLNEPVIGASVVVKNDPKVGSITNIDGQYSIQAASDATLVFSFIGYKTTEVKVNGRSSINVTMEPDVTTLDEVIVVGYGVQKKVTLTGAVAGVKGDEMKKVRNENPQNMLAGKIAGVRVWQKSSEPGAYANSLDIRGQGGVLVVIDGVPRTTEDFQRLNPADIDDISVLKDASAAIYGVRAANGVLLVTTKKGTTDGKTKVAYTGSFTLQKPSGMPVLANPFETMTLYNEKSMNNVDGGSLTYTESDFEAYRNGTRRPTDWTSLLFSDYSPQTQHDLSITGGNEKTQYYIGTGYSFQEGFFKTGDLNYSKVNLRSNITTEILKGIKVDLSLSGVADERNNPYARTIDIIRNYWRQGSLFPAYADPEGTMLNYEGLDLEENSVAMIDSNVSGHRKYKQKYFQSSASANFDFATITGVEALKGLSAKVLFGYDYRMDNNEIYRKEYYQYSYNPDTDSYNQKLYNPSSPNSIRREMYDKEKMITQLLLNYNRTFGKHTVSGVLGWEGQTEKGDNFYALREIAFSMPYLFVGQDDETQKGGSNSGKNDVYEHAYSSYIGRLNYSYDNRYIIEGQFRYDGSSKFTPDNRWGFFPSASAGWRISEEPFFKEVEALSFVNQLKVRASYGVMGDDGSLEYDWATGYKYPATSGNADKGYYNQYAPGFIFGDSYVTAHSPLALPNMSSTWYTSHTFDIGVDFEGWDGLFGFAFDYFDRRRTGIFERRGGDLPSVVGAEAPRENVNSDRDFGIDLELSHRNKIGDLLYKVKAIGTITRREHRIAVDKGPYGNSYDKWRNDNKTYRYQGVQFGYESAGRYTSWKDIREYQIYKDRDILPGDYKYVDWNGDGEISGLDEHPFAFDQTPWLNYSVSIDLNYKNFDLAVLFQGSALGSMEYKEPLYSIWGSKGGGALTQYLDRWHPIDATADPYANSTQWVSGYYGYTGHYPRANSEFNRVSTAYLRLKSIELGYTLPRIKGMKDMNLRVFANSYNLFTITAVKFVDPEHPDEELGRLYPLNKTFTVGLSLSF